MSQWFLGSFRTVVQALVAHDSAGQIAAGVAIGAVLGLLPKATLLALAFVIALGALRVNRAAGLAAAGLTAALTPLLDPMLHWLGIRVLSVASLQPTFAWLYEAPLGPWIGFHNTVGMGALLVGLYVAYPLFLAVRTVLERIRPRLVRWIQRYRIARVLLGADVVTRWGSLQ
ncbi:MAG: TIGR03546 family protein [Planctomycetota bacterium]